MPRWSVTMTDGRPTSIVYCPPPWAAYHIGTKYFTQFNDTEGQHRETVIQINNTRRITVLWNADGQHQFRALYEEYISMPPPLVDQWFWCVMTHRLIHPRTIISPV